MRAALAALALLWLQAPGQAQAGCVSNPTPSGTHVLCSGPTTGFNSFPGTTVEYTFDPTFAGTNFGFATNTPSAAAISAIFQSGASVTDPGMSGFRGGNVSSFTGILSAGASFGSFNIQSLATVNINVAGTSDYIFANQSLPTSLITVTGTVNSQSPPELGRFATITLREGTVDIKQGGVVNPANSSTAAIVMIGGNTARAVTNNGLVNGDVILQGDGMSTVINTGTIVGGVDVQGNANKSLINAGTIDGSASLSGGGTKRVELQPTGVFTGSVGANGGTFVLGGPGAGTFNLLEIGSKYVSFGDFAKEGTSTWTVMGNYAAAQPWTIKEGNLAVASGAESRQQFRHYRHCHRRHANGYRLRRQREQSGWHGAAGRLDRHVARSGEFQSRPERRTRHRAEPRCNIPAARLAKRHAGGETLGAAR